MGQYYTPVILEDDWKEQKQPVKATLKCYDYDNGAKLMEHSYVHNNFVGAAMRMIDLFDKDKTGVKFAWVGDYADAKDTKVYPIKTIQKKNDDGSIYYDTEGGVDLWDMAYTWMEDTITGSDGKERDEDTSQYSGLKMLIKAHELYQYRYLINWTKREFVAVPKFKKDAWYIHPLPILTADGVGRGGGDYRESDREGNEKPNAKFVGTWAYDRISVTNDKRMCAGLKQLDWFREEEA